MAQRSTGKGHIQGGLVAQFHADVYRIGDDVNAAAVAGATRHRGGCGARSESHGVMFADQLRGGHANAAFLFCRAPFAFLKRRVEAERLVLHLPSQLRTVVGTMHQAALLKPC